MRISRTDLIPLLAIVGGGAVGLLTFGPQVLWLPPDDVPAREAARISRSGLPISPTGTREEVAAKPVQETTEVAAEGVRETMESLITAGPYKVLVSGRIVLPEETHLAVYPNYNGGTARGGDDRLIVVLQDPTYRRNSASASRSFRTTSVSTWPSIRPSTSGSPSETWAARSSKRLFWCCS